MLCPKCNLEVQPTDAFCGNCGQALAQPMAQQTAPVAPVQPAVAAAPVATQPMMPPQPAMAQPMAPQPTAMPGQQTPMMPIAGTQPSSSKPTIAIVLGAVGIVGALIMPLIGIVGGITAIVLAAQTMKFKKALAITGLVLGILALLVALIVVMGRLQKMKEDGSLDTTSIRPYVHVLTRDELSQ